MKESIASKAKKLCQSYLESEISLKDFQFQLEPLLGSFESMSKVDVAEVKKIINQMEVIIYTIPELSQKNEVNQLIPKVLHYIKMKTKAEFQHKQIDL